MRTQKLMWQNIIRQTKSHIYIYIRCNLNPTHNIYIYIYYVFYPIFSCHLLYFLSNICYKPVSIIFLHPLSSFLGLSLNSWYQRPMICFFPLISILWLLSWLVCFVIYSCHNTWILCINHIRTLDLIIK